MDGGVLGEVGEFTEKIAELIRVASPGAVAVVVFGSMAIGYFASSLLRANLHSNGPNTGSMKQLAECKERNADLERKIASYSRVVTELEKDDADLWSLHPPTPRPQLAERLRAARTKYILVGHLKGGVSKTTTLANLAAYFDAQGRRVLCIDFDYQGSLTATLLQTIGSTLSPPYSDALLSGGLTPQRLIEAAEPMRPILNRTWLFPASYTLVQKENQLLISWLLNGADADVRYRLVELLLSPEVQAEYDIVLMDMGPRLTTASVSALAAATHLLVPTILDKLSAEAVGSFLNQAKTLTTEMKTGLSCVSVVGTMTKNQELSAENKEAADLIRNGLQRWDGDAQLLTRNIPFRQAFIDYAGRDIAYKRDAVVREFFDELGSEVSRRIGL